MIDVPARIRTLCMNDGTRKNFRVSFPNGENTDLTNENISSESVSLKESINTKNGGLKFGNCEASVLQFECDIAKNITGFEIKAWLEIDISTESEAFIAEYGTVRSDLDYPVYTIYYGSYTVNSCKKNANGLRKIEAYSDIYGDYSVEDGAESYEYGLSEVELQKMSIAVTENVPYVFNVERFIRQNVKNYAAPSEELTEKMMSLYDMDCSIGITYTDGGEEKEGSLRIEMVVSGYFYPTYAGDGAGLYWTQAADEEEGIPLTGSTIMDYIDECIKDHYGIQDYSIKEESAYPLGILQKFEKGAVSFFGQYPYNVCTNFVGIGPNEYYYPYINGYFGGGQDYSDFNLYTANGIKISMDRVVGDKTIDYQTSFSNHLVVYKVNDSPLDKDMSFPRTIKHKIKKKKSSYEIDYKAIFGSGLEVTKKDKKGNEVTTTYVLSFRELVEGLGEVNACFGASRRKYGYFSYRSLAKPGGKYPAEDLYPSDSLTPDGNVLNIEASHIISALYQDDYSLPYGKVTCTCSPTDQDTEITLEWDLIEDVDLMSEDEYRTYDLSDNYLIKVFPGTTDEISGYIQTVAEALQGFQFMPVSATVVGMPYIEAGDWILLGTEDRVLTNVFSQTIKGIQHLQTTLESEE